MKREMKEQVKYPCSFEDAFQEAFPLCSLLRPLGSVEKVMTIGETLHGKVFLARCMEAASSSSEDPAPVQPATKVPLGDFALKASSKKAAPAGKKKGLENPVNEIYAVYALSELMNPPLPNVAKFFFAAEDPECIYLATEYCVKGELFDFVARYHKRFTEPWIRDAIEQVLKALGALHRKGVVHRDFSLENVLIDADGRLKLIDFAQACLVHADGDVDNEAPVPASPGETPGKTRYRPPELVLRSLKSEPYLAKKCDMYALGVCLYILTTGEYPASSLGWNRGASAMAAPATDAECPRTGASLEEAWLEESFKAWVACDKEQRAAAWLHWTRPAWLEESIEAGVRRDPTRRVVSPGLRDFLRQLLAWGPLERLSAEQAEAHPWMTGAVDDLAHG
jgi:serine/threonine protein kinase